MSETNLLKPTDKTRRHCENLQVKFKTELCNNWKTGLCPFGVDCAFAHGVFELRKKVHVSSKYKTKNCRSFVMHGDCKYGERCQFIHPTDNHSRSTSPSPNRVFKKRLPIFIRLETGSN